MTENGKYSWSLPQTMFSKSNILRLFVFVIVGLFFNTLAWANLVPIVQVTGKISVSVSAKGDNNQMGYSLQVNRPGGTRVRGAFLMAASYGGRSIADGDITFCGQSITWNKKVINGVSSYPTFFHSVFADVTGIVKAVVDIASSSPIWLSVIETDTDTIDGTILVVIFDDPNQTTDSSVLLLFGGQSTSGDTFKVTLKNPLGTTNPNSVATMGLGISYGYQGSTGTGQVSQITIGINNARLTSSAGGEDDGGSYNGGLITVGGIGDSIANPDPFAPSSGFRADDELYDLRPFLTSGTTSIVVNTFNPSDDDNILFAYFVTSEPAAIVPPVTPPGGRAIVGTIDPTLPTIVLTHGLQKEASDIAGLWTGTGNLQASSLIKTALGSKKANIIQYVWQEAFQPFGCVVGLPNDDAYKAAWQNVVDAGLRLASELRHALGSGYNKEIHFVGHSLGTAVNTYAATALLDQLPSVTKAQFTALDRPHHVTKICNMSDTEERIYGFNSDFFAMNLPLSRSGLNFQVDNYFSLDGAGVGDVANGKIYNHPALVDSNRLDDPILGNEVSPDNSHSGVHEWYRWTMSPNNPFPNGATVCDGSDFVRPPSSIGQALNPCQRGWYWSLLNNPGAFPSNNGASVSRGTAVLLRLFDPREFGCTITSTDTRNRVVCNEASSPFALARIEIPEGAKFLTFKYFFEDQGDGDYAVIFLDGIPIWVLAGASASINSLNDSGAIPVDGFTGSHDLMVALFGVGEKNFGFTIDDIKVFDVVPNQPPDIRSARPDHVLSTVPDHKLENVSIVGVTDPDGDPVSINIDRIMQDEPTNGLGDGDTCPDAAGIGTSVARVRVERSGTGNGRIYTIYFTATDGKGGTSSGSIKVGVPLSTVKPAVDNGPIFDSSSCK